MPYSLTRFSEQSDESAKAFMQEFMDAGEICWPLHYVDKEHMDEWKELVDGISGTTIYAFCVRGELVGVVRISKTLVHYGNGRLGVAIRPSQRGNSLASIMILLAKAQAEQLGIEDITACIDVNNERSARSFISAGFVPTEQTFLWKDGRTARKFVPKER